ncbi:glycine betaine ABC transporter substrate-binding protein [Gordonia sp. ABSL1-1]|uniref:glycine betaine ABC transporter substrate-binding protein n=1 Tax=Gordonia sp. ABSL1-1 TaxID=3053923 RepID=UPI0025735CFF|nr:glycine betaine ABC transporter substrate-binding protein [Gordonia sp. ABSL1-1]MDL9937061.1 glycine betaine ABC transporter substrate-binding protein [Gordonia sp. ABSL1-1]
MRKAILTVVVAVALGLAGCAQPSSAPTDPIRIGSADTAALRVMAEIYAGALRNSGSEVAGEMTTGDDARLLDEMDHAELDLFPAFTGGLLSELTPAYATHGVTGQPRIGSADEVYDDVNRSLPQGVSVGDPTPVSAAPQIFVATRLAEQSGVGSLGDCSRLPTDLPVLAITDPSPETLRAFVTAGCRLGPVRVVGDVVELLNGLAEGRAIGVLSPLAVAGLGEEADGVQALKAPLETGPVPPIVGPRPQILVPVFRTAALSREDVKTVNKVAGEITTADLAAMARQVDAGKNPREVAITWLGDHGL